ncbi:MarR family transcriptional regulator [Gordonia sp. CPCC 206044]|uniref:MarR family winged helix-turn-helix transcriptional regulator n=1 Tax=Gordonia sp. CPCC 206044 TaxID=3140793 RepID=UPI003AF3DC66
MDLAFELHDLVRTLDRHAEKLLRAEDLSYNRFVALVILSEHPGLTVRQLAGALGISDPSASALVRKLVAAGFVENVAPPGSGNMRLLTITEEGRTKQRICSALLGNSLDDNAARVGIDPDDLARTIRALHTVVQTTHTDQGA